MQFRARAVFVFLFLIAAISACTSRDISTAIAEQYKQSKGALISLPVAAPGDWDRVCILGPYSGNKQATKVLGFDWNAERKTSIGGSDAISLLVFVKNEEVVFFVEHPRGKGDFSSVASKCFSQTEAVFQYDANPNTGSPGLYPKS